MENQSLEDKIEDLRKALIDTNKMIHEAFAVVDKNFETLQNQITKIDGKIDALADQSNNEFKAVGGQLNDLKQEVIKIQKVSNYPEQYENLLKISK